MAASHTYLVTITYMGRQYITIEAATTKGAALMRATRERRDLYEAVKAKEAEYDVERVA